MKRLFLISSVMILALTSFCQVLPKKPVQSDVRAYNQYNLLNIELGMTKEIVIEKMGGVRSIQTYSSKDWSIRDKSAVICNPYSRDIKTDKDGNSIEILWYLTDEKENDRAINKDELTPIIFENNAVVGIGWGFYQDYANRKEITIDIK